MVMKRLFFNVRKKMKFSVSMWSAVSKEGVHILSIFKLWEVLVKKPFSFPSIKTPYIQDIIQELFQSKKVTVKVVSGLAVMPNNGFSPKMVSRNIGLCSSNQREQS